MTSELPSNDPNSQKACPLCRAALAAEAVLCVACGYHLGLQRHLATLVNTAAESEPGVRGKQRAIDPNPFASPQEPAAVDPSARRGEHESDLTDWGARRAKAIVDEADMVYPVIIFACCCGPLWLLMLPWYGWRLWLWHQLNEQFSELRHPYGFSPHGELAASFQDSRLKLWIGLAAGAIYWGIVLLYLAILSLSRAME